MLAWLVKGSGFDLWHSKRETERKRREEEGGGKGGRKPGLVACTSQVGQCRLIQEDPEFKANLGYRELVSEINKSVNNGPP